MKLKHVLSALAAYGVLGVLICCMVVIAVYVLSWAVTCGIVKLICVLVGYTFTWKIGTAVWLACLIIKWLFDNNRG